MELQAIAGSVTASDVTFAAPYNEALVHQVVTQLHRPGELHCLAQIDGAWAGQGAGDRRADQRPAEHAMGDTLLE